MPSTAVPSIGFRSATREDCAHLVLFADMATGRLASFLWEQATSPGQSSFEHGRNVILHDETHFTHFGNWHVAEREHQIVGALNGYLLPRPPSSAPPVPELVRPLNELKNMAAGTWYISAVAIYPEHQFKGFGSLLLAEGERIARSSSSERLTLMVGSFNSRAYRLYQRFGFTEWARRPFVAFPGSETGEWILMVKELSKTA